MGISLLAYLLTLLWLGLELGGRLVRTRYWDLPVAMVWLAALLVLMQYVAMGYEIPMAIQVPMFLTFLGFCAMVLADRLRRRKNSSNTPNVGIGY